MFHSQELAIAVSELEPLADIFKEKADQISHDIRELEKFLTGKFIGIEIGLNVQDHHIDDDHMKLFELADHGKIGGFLLREFLVWGKDESSQKFRLLYEKHSLNSVLRNDDSLGYEIRSEKKPLIECSLFDRLRMRNKLHLLVDHMKNGLMRS